MPTGAVTTWTAPSFMMRVGYRALKDFRRATKSPFLSRSNRPLLVHCAHHKAGTVWFRQILLSVMRPYGLRYQDGGLGPIRSATDVAYFENAGKFSRDLVESRVFRGSHVIRDPRDLIVSGYEYHKVTHEAWVHKPDPLYGGLSYQAYLNSLTEHEGMMVEIERMGVYSANVMGSWDYRQPEFIELRYEDAFNHEGETFEKLFRWYGLNDEAIHIGIEAVERVSLKRDGATSKHARSGSPGEWKERLSPAHVERFKELTGDLTVRLGYESSMNW